MATRERSLDRAGRTARRDTLRLGDDIHHARVGSGLSQRSIAATCGVDPAQVSRLERGLVTRIDLPTIYCLADCVGLEARLRLYPAGDAIRDTAHTRLLERLRRRLHPDLGWRTEIPLPIAGDRRAWDAGIYGDAWWRPVEAETVLQDGQALERRLALKCRDGGVVGLILLVADTPRNRAALRAMTNLVAATPLRTRAILEALIEARDPGPGGIVVL
jgi:transcriptional regulator with XRE-family HTH domain